MLAKLCELANKLGSPLDYTATSYVKLRDYQKAWMYCYRVLYGALVDDPENDMLDENWADAETALKNIIELTKTVYPDRQGEINMILTNP